MRALVISGGGSKGAFGGGVAQYLLQEKLHKYDILIGSSTGSLLIPHLALGEVNKIYDAYTHVNMSSIFDINPFVVKHKNEDDVVTINHFNVLLQFLKGKRTFGESHKLRAYIKQNFTKEEFNKLLKLAILCGKFYYFCYLFSNLYLGLTRRHRVMNFFGVADLTGKADLTDQMA